MALNIGKNPYSFGSPSTGVGGYSGRGQQGGIDAENLNAQENPAIAYQAQNPAIDFNIDQLKVGQETNPFAGGTSVRGGGQYGVAATQGSKAAIPSQNAVHDADNPTLAQNLARPNGIQYQSPDISNNGINDNWMKNYYA